ncbi:MAG: DUF4249 domain-containing protein [Bacteroidales bacterium]|nr:DUF4249 domain-containing protein [Bacteroidales bacterium]
MRASKQTLIGFLLLFIVSCVEPYQPEISEMQDLLVVNGRITDRPGEHLVEVSRSSPYNDPAYNPVTGCVVRVEDFNGTGVTYAETRPGVYSAYLDEPFLGVNKAYKLYVFTPDGQEYQSEYDSLLECPSLQNLYYRVESRETEDPDITYFGLQFFVDVMGERNESRNFLWKLEESFEYNSAYRIQFIWNNNILTTFNPLADSLYTCYLTQPVKELYTASTTYLSENELNRYPLSFVSNQTNKLLIKYSLLASQHSLSEEAYLYWDRITNQLSEGGGLYEKQPSGTDGNIFNVNDAGEKVLGYFYASQVKEKRIIVENTFGFRIPEFTCTLDTANGVNELGETFLYMISFSRDPSYPDSPPYGYGDPSCFDCRMKGGTTEPPDYWNDEQ